MLKFFVCLVLSVKTVRVSFFAHLITLRPASMFILYPSFVGYIK